ncbi:MAG: hypothetical protein JWO31_1475 [Phycisphaerales bacterium]|nr:hypothetical protein [Phycisphaerales bacterium]
MALPSRSSIVLARPYAAPQHRTPSGAGSRRDGSRAVLSAARANGGNVVEVLEDRRLMAVQPVANLINAATDKVIVKMTDKMTINMGTVGTRLNIEGVPSGTAGSIQFKIDGASIKTESYAAYTIGGDQVVNNKTDYLDWTPPVGTHTLQVVQWSKANGTGTVQGTTTLAFTAVAPVTSPPVVPPVVPPPPAVQPAAYLVNAATDARVGTLTDGYVVDMAALGTRLNIEGVPSGTAGSLDFRIDGTSIKTESFAAYTIGGDQVVNGKTDYLDWTPPVGAHTLQVVQFSGAGGTGSVQGSTTVGFTVLAAAVPPTTPPVIPPVVVPPGVPGINWLTLVNATTGASAGTLPSSGAVLTTGNGQAYTVRAEANGSDVEKVAWMVDGEYVALDETAPFTLGGEAGSILLPWNAAAGAHTIVAVPYAADGTAGASVSAAVTVKDAPVSPPTSPPTSPPPTTSPPTSPPASPPPGAVPPPPGTTWNGGTPSPVIKIVGQSGVAGLPVAVNAVSSTLPNSVLYATYAWDFGDPKAAYNNLPGWTAGHVYDTPGTYTLKLTITDANGKASTTSTTVSVAGDSRRVVYVDAASGNDSNAGTSGAPIKSFTKAASLAKAGNVKILFKRGQTWNTNAALSITGANVHLGAYGTGANPILNVVGGTTAIQTFSSATHAVIEDLTFDSPYKPVGNVANKTGVSAMYIGGTGVAVRDCTFLNVDDAINANQNPNGLIVQDNDAPSVTGIRGYLLWAQGTDVVVLGNTAANSTREHVLRAADMNRILIAYNNFTNLGRGSVDSQDGTKGTIEIQRGSYAYVYGNTVKDGPLRVAPRGDDTEAASTKSSWVVFQNNNVNNYQINVNPGAQHVMIRGNTINDNAQSGIAVNPIDPQGRTVLDLNILDNLGTNTASSGRFLRVEGGLPSDTITLGRNVYRAPNLAVGGSDTVGVSVSASNLAGFKTIFDNIWPVAKSITKYAEGGIMWVNGSYAGSTGYKTPAEWLAYSEVDGDIFRN